MSLAALPQCVEDGQEAIDPPTTAVRTCTNGFVRLA